MLNLHFYTVAEMGHLVGQVSQIFLIPSIPSAFSYKAGQYVNVLHRDQSVSPLSIACAPNPSATLEFHLFHPPENSQAMDLLHLLHQDKGWNISGPFGYCTIDFLHSEKPIIFIARGTGFAPIKAVIEAFSQMQDYPPLHLYWSMPQRDDFYLGEIIEKWTSQLSRFTFTPVFLDKRSTAPVSLCEMIVRDYSDFSHSQVYASGSPVFARAVFSALQARGLQREFFYSDVM